MASQCPARLFFSIFQDLRLNLHSFKILNEPQKNFRAEVELDKRENSAGAPQMNI
jgi:hypothetical protein